MQWIKRHSDDVMFALLAAAVFLGAACLDGAENGIAQALTAALQFAAEETPHVPA